MGIEITRAGRGRRQPPQGVLVIMKCDGCSSGFFPTRSVKHHPDGFIAIYAEFMRDGWKDTFRNNQRVFLGPCCSGKKERNDEPER